MDVEIDTFFQFCKMNALVAVETTWNVVGM